MKTFALVAAASLISSGTAFGFGASARSLVGVDVVVPGEEVSNGTGE